MSKTTQPGSEPPADPADDPRSNYDYRSSDIEEPELVDDLEAIVDGDVRFDTYSRNLYATDASAYHQLPIGVVIPTSVGDVRAVMEYCAEHSIPVLPRGGGTSLAGQTVNEAVVLDFKKQLDGVIEVDPEAETVTAQPGITLARLNNHLSEHGLKYAPDPAWGDKSVLGGCIGNNTTGAHSLKYEKADGYVEEVEVVLADGTVTTFGWMDVEKLHDRADSVDEDSGIEERVYAVVSDILRNKTDEIEARYPDLTRNVSGYNFDKLLQDVEARGEVNVGRLLAGSEGTLGIITEATVSLEPIPEETSVVLLTYDDVISAMRDVAPILEHDPAAVEVMDDVLLDLARDTAEFSKLVGTLPEGTDSTLLVEFYADSVEDGKRKIADLLADRLPGYEAAGDPSDDGTHTGDAVQAVDALEAYDDDRKAKFWKMRKSGLPILLSRTGDEKHWPFVEDTAVPAENLPEYVADIQELFDEYDTFASYYAHAGPGVLHIRPLLDLKADDGVERMLEISDAITDLVIEYGGSVSGEHGDGRARTTWNKKLYGEEIWQSFEDLKAAFDPQGLLNPGNVSGDFDPTENLRYDTDYEFDAGFTPELNWDNENGFQGMTELCHGCAGCTGHQDTTGSVMCPTYRATENEEITTTRGRANMLRRAMSGDLPEDVFSDEFIHEVMDLCIGCKGCKRDCPSGVDMAKLKTEVKHEYHQREGIPFRDRLFANVETLYRLGSTFAPLSNVATSLPGSGILTEKVLGIARERDLPNFKRNTLKKWDANRTPAVSESEADRKALVIADPYTNYTQPEVGKAAVRTLEAAGVHVEIPDDVTDSGRPAHSKCMLDESRATAQANVDALAPRVEDGWDVVSVEPSDSVMYQNDYLDLLSGPDVEAVAENAYSVMQYIDTFRLDEALETATDGTISYHGHCHQTASSRDHHAVGVLRRAGYDVDVLDTTCCGMAGSFGYEAEHYSMSQAIGRLLFDAVEESPADEVTAPGTSCRSQLAGTDRVDGKPPHPIEKLDAALQ
ncbi:FAD-dependent oxidoreductase (GlcD/DLD_GlcF/GlpC domain fusion protein) [Natronomonas moolapensis 8.8.11]|uniref:D-lactate dehydrogenase (cytochrome) n=1 Tax=Natronomonas moolapensis (strain DSM 18674 / CECT 7526 / JCM 14361 / 8.8.11) TaxID=268739 RepID=M1XYX0_NATM8|nr:FAD-binding and (Fe-S)-binding domain-containing protein [Natronomonas moolapensis]CCQ35333.1 FAD-dependent oxidoreductase (GlcD/DLD_GlcF/GlpC domain fusion protein) [Natronomonas moolapensis 8.8.11]